MVVTSASGASTTVCASVPGVGEHLEPGVVLVVGERRLVGPLGRAVRVADGTPAPTPLAVRVGDHEHRVGPLDLVPAAPLGSAANVAE